MYNNKYNNSIADRVKRNSKKQIARQEQAATMGDTSFTSHLEGMALRDANVEGGSGYAEATARDQGFPEEATNGVVGSGEPKKRRTRKSKQEGGAILGLADIATDPRGDPPPPAPLAKIAPSSSKMKPQTEPVVISEMPSRVGGAKRVNKYALLVKEIMQKNKMKLPEASKYIKDNNLYKKD